MIRLSREAETQIDDLVRHFERADPLEAVERLMAALEDASRRILRVPGNGATAPRPYLALASLGFRWIKAGRYWVAYEIGDPAIIVGIFSDAADIPGRMAN